MPSHTNACHDEEVRKRGTSNSRILKRIFDPWINCRFFFFCSIIQRKGIICSIFKSYRLSSNRDRLLSRGMENNDECVEELIWREIWIGLHRISAKSFHSSTSHDSIGLRVNNSAFDIKITRWRDIIGPFVDHGQGHSLPSRGNSFWFRLTTDDLSPSLSDNVVRRSGYIHDDCVIFCETNFYFLNNTCLCFYY